MLEKEVHEVPDDPKDVPAIATASDCISVPKDNVTDNVFIRWTHRVTSRSRESGSSTSRGLHNLKELVLPEYKTERRRSCNFFRRRLRSRDSP